MISDGKLKHSLGVAKACQQYGKEMHKSEEYCDALFVMGFLHDIGYEKSPDTNHPNVGGSMIESFIKHPEMLEAIKSHGKKFEDFNTADIILNMSDLTVNSSGKPCTVYERLEDIKWRYGEDSEHFKNAMLLVKALDLTEDL